MKTLQQEWLDYKRRVYPHDISPLQEVECHQAFFAGAAIAMAGIVQNAQQTEEEAVRSVAAMFSEVENVMQDRLSLITGKRN